MTSSNLAAFWAVSMLFVITPGADWAYAIAAGMRPRAVAPAVAGLLLGHAVATLVVAAGVGALVAGIAGAMTALTVVGSGYLLWLGVGLLARPPVPNTGDEQAPDSRADWTIRGFCVSGLNPKVFLLFLALLPQFTDPAGSWAVPAQITALGTVHIVNCGVVYVLVGYSSQAVLSTRPRAARAISRASGGAMIAIALLLLAERFIR
jgi:threonine/homoserine/homoserine lactone efflux protein